MSDKNQKHLYVFVTETGPHSFGEGHTAVEAYEAMIAQPGGDGGEMKRFRCTAWRLADDAQGIPVGGGS